MENGLFAVHICTVMSYNIQNFGCILKFCQMMQKSQWISSVTDMQCVELSHHLHGHSLAETLAMEFVCNKNNIYDCLSCPNVLF